MISCGADKSIYFRSAQQVEWGSLLGSWVGGLSGYPLKALPALPGLRWTTLCSYPPRGREDHLV